MDTAFLKTFATWARTELLAQVEARITATLAPHSRARSEFPSAVKTLEDDIRTKGENFVREKAAYTWFNRIVAFRFMDANGYNSPAVVSPGLPNLTGQPQILADAKGAQFSDAIPENVKKDVLDLLTGNKPSNDAQGEAYLKLLVANCEHRSASMPFLFENESHSPHSDYTAILAPANLLAPDSVITRAVEELTSDVCRDVEVIGWLYQFYNSERKDEVFTSFKKNKKATAAEIPPATQLFTPHWIVRYLAENSIGRLWMLNRPDSQLKEKMDFYIEPTTPGDNAGFLKVNSPEELTVVDPACGSGHMLTYAFDLLYAIYEEEGYSPSDIPSLILKHNLYGLEIDPRAASLASFALMMKARAKQRTFLNPRKRVEPNVRVVRPIEFSQHEVNFLSEDWLNDSEAFSFWNVFKEAETLGSLIQPDASLIEQANLNIQLLNDDGDLLLDGTLNRAHDFLRQAELLSRKYAVAIVNPPYMGSKNMSPQLTEFAKANYTSARSDLMTMFMVRTQKLLLPKGWWAMINLPSWMFLSSFESFRSDTLKANSLDSMLHLGRGVFGSDFGSVAFVFNYRSPQPSQCGTYRKLFDRHVEVRTNEVIKTLFSNRTYNKYIVPQESLTTVPGTPIVYWLSNKVRSTFSDGVPLAQIGQPRQGLATADNNRFLRMWWEVSSSRSSMNCETRDAARATGSRWFPYNKGGEFRKWYGNQEHVINWGNDGEELFALRPKSVIRSPHTYFQPSVSWSKISSGDPAFRQFPPGFIYDVAGTSIFADNPKLRKELAAFSNSSVALELLRALAPTLNYEVGQIAQLPVRSLAGTEAASNVDGLTTTSKQDWDDFETSWNFKAPSWLQRTKSSGDKAIQLTELFETWSETSRKTSLAQQEREAKNNQIVAEAYGLADEVPIEVPLHRVSLTRNVEFRYGPRHSGAEYEALERADFARELISYAIGCVFGRFSLDKPGFILNDEGSTLEDYARQIPQTRFEPDIDNVIPIVEGDWFEDDIVTRVRTFLRVAFGDRYLVPNIQFLEEALGVKTLREYFIARRGKSFKSPFYEDHTKRYKKRPIYWMFSSPSGAFNALIYLHRYSPSTASTVLNEYLRNYQAKLEAAVKNLDSKLLETEGAREKAKLEKEITQLRKVLVELEEYEQDILYPLAAEKVELNLDDGVKANYEKLGAALRRIK